MKAKVNWQGTPELVRKSTTRRLSHNLSYLILLELDKQKHKLQQSPFDHQLVSKVNDIFKSAIIFNMTSLRGPTCRDISQTQLISKIDPNCRRFGHNS
jgi:hypothetical protein